MQWGSQQRWWSVLLRLLLKEVGATRWEARRVRRRPWDCLGVPINKNKNKKIKKSRVWNEEAEKGRSGQTAW